MEGYGDILGQLRTLIGDPRQYDADELQAIISEALTAVPDALVLSVAKQFGDGKAAIPDSPMAQAMQLDDKYRCRPHIVYMNERITQAVADVEAGKNRLIQITMPPRTGKQIADSELVLTTDGWKRHGDLRVGDRVFSPSGHPVEVLGVAPPSMEKMRVTFTDGSSVVCHPNHEWTVFDRARGQWRTVETRYLAERVLWLRGRRGIRGGRTVIQLPSIRPLEMPERDLPVDPYTLGVWLGDGTRGKASVCGAQADLDAIVALIPYPLGARWVHPATGVHYQYITGGFSKALRKSGVYRDKHIPEEYQLASVRQRRSLLAGLVDTDGTVDVTGRTTVTSSSSRLAADIRSLVRSLGYRAGLVRIPMDTRDRSIRGRSESWAVQWTQLDGEPSGRALARKRRVKHGVQRRIGVASVEPAPDEPGRCIEVDSPDGLYLVGETLLPTHNSRYVSETLPVWILRKHPDWKIGMVSYGDPLAVGWGRSVRRTIEGNPGLGIKLAPDLAMAAEWETAEGGGIVSRGINSGYVGKGFKVLIVDDPIKGTAEAHSKAYRDAIWERWTSDLYSRLEPPYLVLVLHTRYHEDDFIGRLNSPDYAGDPANWERIDFPALAESADVLGRAPGEPLLSPLLDETVEEALARWEDVKSTVGSYYWASLYQQHPAPSKGTIFDISCFRYWTVNPDRLVKDEAGDVIDETIRLIRPETDLQSARWLDSWDMAFKGTDTSDWVVGQRWARSGPTRYLLAQKRGRWTFTQTLKQVKEWLRQDNDELSPWGRFVHQRLIEDKANGTAIIDVLHKQVAGIKEMPAKESKESRARAITPEVESGHVYLPHPQDPGNEWVLAAIDEIRDFPHGKNDDVVDSLVHALTALRDEGIGIITVPKRRPAQARETAASMLTARRSGITGRSRGPRIPGR